jgi:magnesium transporter
MERRRQASADEKRRTRRRLRALRPRFRPVVDGHGKLIARVTVNAVVDYIREETDSDRSPPGACARTRTCSPPSGAASRTAGTWLAVNLVTAFIASRVIGLFEHSIAKLVALLR